ncbi:MAG: Omp28-related outer membrane protein [candidate division WOR-3 bacterium]
MLDQICYDYAGYVVAVEWHVSSSYPLYSAEARAKWRMYPPPYNGSYATPWLWVDGRQRGYNYNLWRNYVASQISVPTPVLITLSGNYDPATREGEIKALIQNDSTEDLTARVSVVVTEDSIYYAAPNGDPWHNHVCRDYIPDQTGTVLTIPAGAADSVILPFTINSNWNEEKCKIVVYAQSTEMVPADSSYPAYQGAEVNILDLVGIQEKKAYNLKPQLRIIPNPVRTKAELLFNAQPGTPYQLLLHSPDGRLLKKFSGIASGETKLRIEKRLNSGIYLYRLTLNQSTFSGKLIVAQ